MPFSFFKHKNDVDYKARLERKMVLVKETPESVFDLSDCNLKTIPNGVLLLCKVLRKNALLLQKNGLTSFQGGGALEDLSHLKCLSLQSNKFSKLPDNIDVLSNLEILDVSDNQLTRIPDTIGLLSNLQQLLLANNKLTRLPITICRCLSLTTLDVRGNNRLLRLPVELGRLRNLTNLYLDETVQFPPSEIYLQDTKTVLDFLAAECGEQPQSPVEMPTTSNVKACTDYFLAEERLRQIEEQKDIQKRRWLELEKTLAEESLKEKEAHQLSKNKQLKLVEDIRHMQSGFDEELSKIQERKDAERLHLIEECLRVEDKVGRKVASLLVNAKKYQSKMAQIAEQQYKLEEELLKDLQIQRKTIENTKVLDVMNELVKEDLLKVEKWQKYEKLRKEDAHNWIVERRLGSMRSSIENPCPKHNRENRLKPQVNESPLTPKRVQTRESESAIKLAELVSKAHSDSKDLAEALLNDEELQKAAVASLLEKSDAKSWQLAQEVALVETQLAELTRLEMSRKKLQLNTQLVELCEARVALTEHLIILFAEKEKRRKELLSTLNYLEQHSEGEDFWLQQYQALLNSTSRQLVESFRNIDTSMYQELLFYGVSHCLPLIATLLHSREKIAIITEEMLMEAGVLEEDERCLILKAIKAYLTPEPVPQPSAPLDDANPSAPPMPFDMEKMVLRASEECVICLDNPVEVIFTPCGHICSCGGCSQLTSCPLCRSQVERVHRIFRG